MERAVQLLRAEPNAVGRRIDLRWENPAPAAFAGGSALARIRIVRRRRSFPLHPDDGDLVYDGPVISAYADGTVAPLATYYYTVFALDSAVPARHYADRGGQAVALATKDYGAPARLYGLLPAVHQRLDAPFSAGELARLDPPVAEALAALPPGLRDRGQLWRFLHSAAPVLDLMRSQAEGLRRLHDADEVPPGFLELLAMWVGWEPDRTLAVHARRGELKFAPRLYRSVGSVPNVRAIVHRYTGWHVQVAEIAQRLAVASSAPQHNVFSLAQEPGGEWRGADDAAPALGFATGNDAATGAAASQPARLTSTATQPFSLRPGMELAVTADDRLPVTVRFGAADFVSIGAATAGEVAAVLNRALSEVSAVATVGGGVELRSNSTGIASAIRVERYAASLVALEGAPGGRLATVLDRTPLADPRTRLFYSAGDPLAGVTGRLAAQASRQAATGGATRPRLTRAPLRSGQLRYKTFRRGAWSHSRTLPAGAGEDAADPAALEWIPGQLLLAWVAHPGRAAAHLRYATGATRRPGPAHLDGRLAGPFRLDARLQLVIHGDWDLPQSAVLSPTDFADAAQATTAEVVTVLGAQLTRIVASAQPDGTLRLETAEASGEARLQLDLRQSTAAAALGFGAGNAEAWGDAGDALDWSPDRYLPSAGRGRHADLTAIRTAKDAWLFWATHSRSRWWIRAARWDGVAWSTAPTVANARGGDREPCPVLDAQGRLWLFWAHRESPATRDDNWTLRRSRYDPAANAWTAPAQLTTTPPAGTATDREPSAALDGSALRIYMRSNRGGSADLWSFSFDPQTSQTTAPSAVLPSPAGDRAPHATLLPGGARWLLFRSDRSVPLSRVATRALPPGDNRVTSRREQAAGFKPAARGHSLRLPDTGAVRRFARTTSAPIADAARTGQRREFDDLLSYTTRVVAPRGPGRDVSDPRLVSLRDDDLYTRGTVALYISQLVPDSPLSRQTVERLRPVLERFLPVNVRHVVILAPRVDVEFVYGQGRDIGEAYYDTDAFERYGPATDAAAVVLPGWIVLRSTTAGHVSVNPDPAHLAGTLKRRTWWEDFE